MRCRWRTWNRRPTRCAFVPGGRSMPRPTGRSLTASREAAAKAWGANYAAAVLDKAGIDKMIANRVAMGPGLPKERFLWAAYADALMYPFPTEILAVNSDRKAFFALEAKLLAEYYGQCGVAGAAGGRWTITCRRL